MSLQQCKFRLALLILVAGMVAALIWHWHEGSIGRPYPYNTFLFAPKARFSDLFNTYSIGLQPNPYWVPSAPYPPTAYALMRLLSYVPANFFVFFAIGVLPILALVYQTMKPVLLEFMGTVLGERFSAGSPHPGALPPFIAIVLTSFLTLVMVLSCEPFLFCIDRGSNELWVIFMVGASLYCYSRARLRASMAWLVLPICLKIYPSVLLVLFLRRHKLRLIFLAVAISAAITAISYQAFQGDMITSFELNQVQLKLNAEAYLIKQNGLSETASPWNLYRSIAITYHAIETATWHLRYWNWAPLYSHFRAALPIYTCLIALISILITIHVAFIEKEVLRRMVVLLVFMVLASPSGAEYKITHIGTALIIFILIRTYRKGDFWVASLLAFTLIPKREFVFEHFGPTDSGIADVSSAVVLNPMALLLSLAILCWWGWFSGNPTWSYARLRSLFPVRLP